MRNSFHSSLLFLFFIFIALLPQQLHADFSMNLNSGWMFRETGQPTQFMAATVPGTVHTDLFANGVIPDPFYGANETKLQWIESKFWEYTTTFECSREMRKEKHIEIQFEGLDTYAFVYLNDSLLFTSEDMFLSYTKDIKPYIRAHNVLRVSFHPASELIEKNKLLSPIKKFPGGDRVFIRKAQYQFGWDFGPRFVTCGIWKPVHVVGWSGMRISDMVYTLKYIEGDTAYMKADFMFQADKAGKYDFQVSDGDSTLFFSHYRYLGKSIDHVEIVFAVPHPRLWWCNGLGKPEMYEFTVMAKRKKKFCSLKTKTGIRKIELSGNTVEGFGTFSFILNDVPVYAKGANWIPSDIFLPRVKNEKINAQLTDMRNLNMNMVRVWGGGVYESDYFYSQCDSLGLMVWQDLPFACSMYPYGVLDKNSTLMMEIDDNHRRIQSHPSIALWCGDNENREGWFNWGWQKEMKYSAADSVSVYSEYMDYQKKFIAVLNGGDPFFPYVMSSPENGWGTKKAYRQGDVHYWGVWWGMEPFSAYESHTGRFVSEFGFQGMPSFHTYHDLGFTPSPYNWWFNDSTYAAHQKHPTGYETIQTYMERDYGMLPDTFEDYVYLSQVMQRDAMTTAIEAQRRNQPTCMGSLFWQYNDCWPGTTWSVEDYYGRKKLSWYNLKRLYAPVLISFEEKNDSVLVWIVNDDSYACPGILSINWTSFTGANVYTSIKEVLVLSNSSMCYAVISKRELFDTLSAENGFLNAKLVSTRSSLQPVVQANHLFGKEIDHNFPVAEPKYSFVRYIKEGPMAFTLSSSVYLHNVMITCDDPNTTFSDNGFDILPGQSYKIDVTTTKTEAEISESLRFTSMNKLVNEQKLKDLDSESED